MQAPYKSCNMETFTLDNVLSREYSLGSLDWLSSQATHTPIAHYGFPEILFQKPYIASKIADFTFFRAGVRLSFRIVAQKFLYGSIMVWWHPDTSIFLNGDATFDNISLASGIPHCILSASEGGVGTFDVPFVRPERAIDLRTYDPKGMGTIGIIVLNPLTDIQGGVFSAKIDVFG